MIMFRKNKKWMVLHISLSLKQLEHTDELIENAVKSKLEETHLTRQWKVIDIVDVKFISSVYQPTKDATFVELLVFVVDLTGEQIG